MKISLNHEEFLQYKYENKSIFEIKLNKFIKNNKYKVISLGSSIILSFPTKCYADVDFTKIDSVGNVFLEIMQKGGYWVIIIVALGDVIRTVTKGGDNNDIFKKIVKYLIIYATMFALPLGFDIVREMLS